MLTLHLVLPLVPKFLPEAPTMCGLLDVSKSFSFSFLYISKDMIDSTFCCVLTSSPGMPLGGFT